MFIGVSTLYQQLNNKRSESQGDAGPRAPYPT